MWAGLFSAETFVGNSQFLSAFCSAGSQHAAAISSGHSLSETVFVSASFIRRLICSFHLSKCLFFSLFFGGAKIHFFLNNPAFEKNNPKNVSA